MGVRIVKDSPRPFSLYMCLFSYAFARVWNCPWIDVLACNGLVCPGRTYRARMRQVANRNLQRHHGGLGPSSDVLRCYFFAAANSPPCRPLTKCVRPFVPRIPYNLTLLAMRNTQILFK